jgi:SlyX protein
MKDEIENLQSRIAFQEDAIETLNEVVTKQDREIQELRLQLQEIYKRMEEVKIAFESGAADPVDLIADEKPPHY